MAGKLSIRISLRWLPDPPSEPTDTLVMTVGGYYMDLRVMKAADQSIINWSMAGERLILSEEPLIDNVPEWVVKCKWTHTIDSRGYTDPDVGSFRKLPNGDDLETGTMACPEKDNALTPYEEVWRELPVPEDAPAWILESEGADDKTFIGRTAGFFMSFRQIRDGSYLARREDWSESASKWQLKYLVGDQKLPSMQHSAVAQLGSGSVLKPGQNVRLDGRNFHVRASKAV